MIRSLTTPLIDVTLLDGSNLLAAKAWVSKAPYLALDTETKGDEIVLLQFGDNTKQWIVDVTKDYDTALQILSFIRRRNILIIGHNLSFDYQKIYHNFEIKLENLFDTMLAAQILDCGLTTKKGHFTLESTARRYYDPYAYSAQTYLGTPHVTKKVRDTFNDFTDLTEEHLTYAALDVIYAFGLYQKLLQALKQADLLKVADLENSFLKVAADMSINGLPINQAS